MAKLRWDFIWLSVAGNQTKHQIIYPKLVAPENRTSRDCSSACKHCRGVQFQKCKPEEAGPWRGPGLGREWARRLAAFSMEMMIFTRFLDEIATTAGSSYSAYFIIESAAPCAKLHAYAQAHCQLPDMALEAPRTTTMYLPLWTPLAGR